MRSLLAIALLCALRSAAAVDVPFSKIVAESAVVDFNIQVQYKDKEQKDFAPYPSCSDNVCPELNWDNNARLLISWTTPPLAEVGNATLKSVGKENFGNPVELVIESCFETPYTKNRKWRKPKDIIQDDKRCLKKLVKKRRLVEGEQSAEFEIKSDTPEAEFFMTLFILCEVEGSSSTEYCGLDTTGPLTALVKQKDFRKRTKDVEYSEHLESLETSNRLTYRTEVIASRPTELVVCVILLSVLSVSMLVLYFVYERALKKSA